jgi:hypothetical protein
VNAYDVKHVNKPELCGIRWAVRERNFGVEDHMTAVLVCLLACGGAALYKLSRRESGPDRRPQPRPRGPFELRTRDVVLIGGEDFVVEGVVQIEEGGKRRRLARLADGPRVRWLMSDETELVLLEPSPAEAAIAPPPDPLMHAGRSYRLAETGGGRALRHGDVGHRAVDRCRFWSYRGPGGERAWIDEFARPELMVGAVVSEGMIEVLPGT